jgi:hypothetical protein
MRCQRQRDLRALQHRDSRHGPRHRRLPQPGR